MNSLRWMVVVLLTSGCVFGVSDDNNENNTTNGDPNGATNADPNGSTNGTTNGTTNSSTNGTTNNDMCLTPEVACTPQTCGEELSDECGGTVQCPECVCDPPCGTLEECVKTPSGPRCCEAREALCDRLGPGQHMLDDGCREMIICVPQGVPTFDQVAAGGLHTCAVLANAPRRVWCWGSNESGQFGEDGPGRTTPGPGPTLPQPVEQLAAGHDHTCTLLADGSVHCWGNNDMGQLTGQGSGPRQIALSGAATRIAVGFKFSCASLTDGTVECWGSNEDEKFEMGGPSTFTPTRVVDDDGNTPPLTGAIWSHPTAGYFCGEFEDSLHCWGAIPLGPTSTPGPSPLVQVDSGTPVLAGVGRRALLVVFVGDDDVTEYAIDEEVIANFGTHEFGPIGLDKLVVSFRFACALDGNAQLWCGGRNNRGQAGLGVTADPVPMVRTVEGIDVERFSLGANHGCAILAGGEMRCWGANGSGQLGVGDMNDRNAPGAISDEVSD